MGDTGEPATAILVARSALYPLNKPRYRRREYAHEKHRGKHSPAQDHFGGAIPIDSPAATKAITAAKV
jgi:hypothetical protein